MEKEEISKALDGSNHHLKYKGWKAMPYIIGNETFEKLATLGTSSNLLVYLTSVFHMKSVTAATAIAAFNGTTNLATVLGAFISDAFLGRYVTLSFSSVASLVGMFILMLTAAVPSLHPAHCDAGQACAGHTPLQLAVLLTSFAFLVIGAGGIRPCSLAFGADQFDPQTESGKKGINSFFNWYYFTLTSAIMVSSTVIIYIQSEVSWSLGYAVPTILMLISCFFFFLGTRIYVKVRCEGSPFTSVVQVLVAAFKKRRLTLLDHPKMLFNPPHKSLNSKLTHTDQFRCLDKASIKLHHDAIKPNGFPEDPWVLCTVQQVEEVKCILRIIPIWSACIIYTTAVVQQTTYVVFQALQSDRHLSKNNSFVIPAGSFMLFSMLALTIWIPIYDRLIVPWIRSFTGIETGITLLQRMGTGILFSIISMVVAALVEKQRRAFGILQPSGTSQSGGTISSMSSLWLIPQLTLMGLAEAFNSIGQLEFYYKQFPENMRSIAGSLVFCSLAISNYLGGFMVTVIHSSTGGEGKESWLAEDLNEGKLDYFYSLLAAVGVINLMYFIACATWYRYKILDGEAAVDLEPSKEIQV